MSASQRHQRFAQEYGQITAISITDKLVGGLLCYKVNNKYFAVLVAFDVDYAKYSIGCTVIYLAIKKAIDEKAAEFHFLWGGSDYVTHYGGDTHLLYTTHNFRSNNLFYYICSYRIKIKTLAQRLKHISWVRPLAPYYLA
ncbi:GNAT family N-acetyltransferase [Bacteroides sp. HPS0048]|uniref:GNAT family N-acetyltransferase n=1 Tax=Bacteroides sp. HPS0048 TaxID=1078089 RepID=UPI0009D9C3D4|nr:GNAT family N-acetyltransferase [Bacteroides sp. HPS0048]